jgi:glycosyltransferase involved in cell wall biosynthesis
LSRILFVMNSFENGAIPNILLDLAPLWRDEGWDCVFLALEPLPENQSSVERCRALGFPVYSLNVGAKSVFRALIRLKRKIRDLKPDLISTHLGRADVYTPWVKGKIPLITTHHNVRQNHGRATNGGYFISDHRVAWRTGVSRAVNESFLANGFLKTPHSVIFNPVNPDRLVPDRSRTELLKVWGWNDPIRLLVSVARLAPAKGYPDLLEALFLLKASGRSDLRLAIAGEGPLRGELEKRIAEKGLENEVRLLGLYPNVADLYAAADGLVFPSLWEGFGLVILEAWLLGCPVAASALPPVMEFVVDGENGVLFAPGNPRAIANGIERLLADPMQAKDWARRGWAVVFDRFSPLIIARQYSDLFHRILENQDQS